MPLTCTVHLAVPRMTLLVWEPFLVSSATISSGQSINGRSSSREPIRPRSSPASISKANAAAFLAAISWEPEPSASFLFSIKSEIPRTTAKHTAGWLLSAKPNEGKNENVKCWRQNDQSRNPLKYPIGKVTVKDDRPSILKRREQRADYSNQVFRHGRMISSRSTMQRICS